MNEHRESAATGVAMVANERLRVADMQRAGHAARIDTEQEAARLATAQVSALIYIGDEIAALRQALAPQPEVTPPDGA